jgi:hypothetical protein
LVSRKRDLWCENLQSGESKNTGDQNFGLSFHLQFPDDEEWQHSKSPVRDTIEYGYDIGVDNDDGRREAFAMMIRTQVPPERYGPALKSDQKAVRDRKDDVEDHNPADNPDVCSDDGDAQEEETDANFQCCCGEGV